MAIKIDFVEGTNAKPEEINQNFIELLALNVYNEIPGGVIDSANVNFTSAFVYEAVTLRVYLTGQTTLGMIRLQRGVDYTETLDGNGNGTGFQTTLPPTTGEVLVIDYQRANI